MPDPDAPYDGLLLVAFGGPEGLDEVEPFLERVTAGRPIPPERLAEVADRYRSVGGCSPINGRLRTLRDAVVARLAERSIDLPVFWGNRNAPPLLTDAVAEMRDAGVRQSRGCTPGVGACDRGVGDPWPRRCLDTGLLALSKRGRQRACSGGVV